MTADRLPDDLERDLAYLCECRDAPGKPGETMARLRRAILAALDEREADGMDRSIDCLPKAFIERRVALRTRAKALREGRG